MPWQSPLWLKSWGASTQTGRNVLGSRQTGRRARVPNVPSIELFGPRFRSGDESRACPVCGNGFAADDPVVTLFPSENGEDHEHSHYFDRVERPMDAVYHRDCYLKAIA